MITKRTVDKLAEQADLQRRLIIYCRDYTSLINLKLHVLQMSINSAERVSYYDGSNGFYSSAIIAVEVGLRQCLI
jgi:hypothetical protein